jgi:hypothetical protein
VAEQRYQAVLAVIGDGLTVSQAAEKTGVAIERFHRPLAHHLDPIARTRHNVEGPASP